MWAGRRKNTRREADSETKLGSRRREGQVKKGLGKNMTTGLGNRTVTGGLDKGHVSGSVKAEASAVGREAILEIWVGWGTERRA